MRVAIVGLICMLHSMSVAAQGPSRCRASDGKTTNLIKYLRERVLPDSANRAQWHLPATDPDSVKLVTTDSLCAIAGDAYNADLIPSLRVTSRPVYVIRILGFYIVYDPDVRGNKSEWDIRTIMDSTFTIVARVAG
jgi:hypothetical protein